MFEGKNYNENNYLFLTKIFSCSENYPDKVKAINKYVELNPKLSKEENKLLYNAYSF